MFDFLCESYLRLENMRAKIMLSITHIFLGTQYSAQWVLSVQGDIGNRTDRSQGQGKDQK